MLRIFFVENFPVFDGAWKQRDGPVVPVMTEPLRQFQPVLPQTLLFVHLFAQQLLDVLSNLLAMLLVALLYSIVVYCLCVFSCDFLLAKISVVQADRIFVHAWKKFPDEKSPGETNIWMIQLS